MNILLADRYVDHQRPVQNALAQLGEHTVHPFQRGDHVLAQLRSANADLLIVGRHLLDTDGIGLVRQVRSDETVPTPPILMIRSEVSEQNLLDLAEQGVDSVLLRPFLPIDLAEKIHGLCGPRLRHS